MGSQFTWWLIAQQPLPIIVFSSSTVFLETVGSHSGCSFPAVGQGKLKNPNKTLGARFQTYPCSVSLTAASSQSLSTAR